MAKLTKTQQRKALAAIDAEIAFVDKALDALNAKFLFQPTSDALRDLWNAHHDARRQLEDDRHEIEMNLDDIPAAEQGTYELVLQNID